MNNQLCFVIMGYGQKQDPESGNSYDLDKTYDNVIKPAVEACGFTCIRGDEVVESGTIDKSMYALLIHADLVIADISTDNPNAMYELGVRHAARPYSTIIMKEKNGKKPFDLNHNKIFAYEHLGADIGATEAHRCQRALIKLIHEVTGNKDPDSPVHQFIPTLIPFQLNEEDYTALIQELSEKQESVYAWTLNAKAAMEADDFLEAAKWWKKLVDKVEGDDYYIQQQALCTYKSKTPSEKVALSDALQIINQLNPNEKSTTDTETLGIAGAINKNLWLMDREKTYLERAIDFYGKGFKINNDYYTGENYALCLDFMANEVADNNEQIYYRVEAKKTRETILEIIAQHEQHEDFENRNDYEWIVATKAHCLLALDKMEEAREWEQKFYAIADANWKKETYLKSKKQLIELHKTEKNG